jgi:multiple sugar transport system permease protein
MSVRALSWTRQTGLSGAARRRLWRQTGVAYLYLAPALILLLSFNVFPAIYGFYISLWRWGLVKERFVGLENYQRILTSSDFWYSLGVTLWYAVMTVPAEMAIGLLIAYLLFQPIKGRSAYRAAFFVPYITSTIASGIIWRWIYNSNNGLLNGVLDLLQKPRALWLQEPTGVFQLVLAPAGVQLPGWAAGPSLALVCIAVMSVWVYTGFNMLLYLAGLGNVSKELYDAARVDGASEWQVFWRITFPLLSPTTFFLLTISTIGVLQVFNQIYAMTFPPQLGGPLDTTRTVNALIFRTFYQQTRVGYGSAIAFLLTGIILLITLVNFRLVGRRVHYE